MPWKSENSRVPSWPGKFETGSQETGREAVSCSRLVTPFPWEIQEGRSSGHESLGQTNSSLWMGQSIYMYVLRCTKYTRRNQYYLMLSRFPSCSRGPQERDGKSRKTSCLESLKNGTVSFPGEGLGLGWDGTLENSLPSTHRRDCVNTKLT